MFRKFLQKLLRRPIIWTANRFTSSPVPSAVFSSLTALLTNIRQGRKDQGPVIDFPMDQARFIILSDQHKGGKDMADDFRLAEQNYLAALQYYNAEEFTFFNIGDCEELWENTPAVAVEKNRISLMEETKFLLDKRYYRTFGNHDLEWKFAVPETLFLKPLFGKTLKVYEGFLLRTTYNEKEYSIFLTHGHQGDKKSDGNAFSTWFVAAVWTPIQRFLEISVNTISDSFELVDKHNKIMYDWSATQQNLIFISGHTHKPVFASLDHLERLHIQIAKANASGNQQLVSSLTEELKRREKEYAGKQFHKTMTVPSYFNTGCCCFSDGDITGIEIADGFIRLVKWEKENDAARPVRKVLEESPLSYVFDKLDAAG